MLGVVHDVTESRLAEQLLRRYELLSDQARDIILFVRREDGRILEANRAAEQAYGYSRDELLARTIHDLRDDEAPTLVAGQMSAAAKDGILFETTHRRSDGSAFPVEVSSTGSIALGAEPVLLSVVRDISERRRIEEERAALSRALERERDDLRVRQAFSRSTTRISNVVNSTLSSDEIMRRVVEAAGKAFRSDSAERHAARCARLVGCVGVGGARRRGRAAILTGAGRTCRASGGRTLRSAGQRLSVRRPARVEAVRYWPARAVLTVPIMVLGRAIGCLSFIFSGAPHDFTPLEVEFGTAVGMRASAALGNAHLFEEQRYIARTLQESYLRPLPQIAGVDMGLAVEIAHHADLIGGDVCDAFGLDDGRIVALMGDVSGKGVAAAGLAAIVRSSIHALSTVDRHPPQFWAAPTSSCCAVASTSAS